MIKQVISIGFLATALSGFGAGIPQVAIEDNPTRSITDVGNTAVQLDFAMTINSKVNGAVQEYDSKYKSYEVDFYVYFDKPIKVNTISLYGRVNSSATLTWALIGLAAGNINQIWYPVNLPKLNAGTGIRLVRQMLGTDATIIYKDSSLFSSQVSFVDTVEKFDAGIKNKSLDNLGTTMTVETCLFAQGDNNVNNRIVLKKFTYKLWDDSPEKVTLFNSYVNRYEQWTNSLYRSSGGKWTSSTNTVDIRELGDISQTGVTDIDTGYDAFLTYNVESVKSKRVGRAFYEMDIEMTPCGSTNDMPVLEQEELTTIGTAVSDDGSVTNYYAMIYQNGHNEYVKLDGCVSNGKKVHIIIDINYLGRTVTYFVDGVRMTYQGSYLLPINPTIKPCNKIDLMGCGKIHNFYGNYDRATLSSDFIFK